MKLIRDEIHDFVFITSILLLFGFVIALALFPGEMESGLKLFKNVILSNFGILFQGSTLGAMVFMVFLVLTPLGSIKLGPPECEPEFNSYTYLSMAFTAGIAAGIVFWGPAEALMHYDSVPPGLNTQSHSHTAAVGALQYSLFHWGFSPWCIYLAIGLPIAYFVYNKGASLRFSALLLPILPSNDQEHWIAKVVDVLAVVATIGGLTATVGLVSDQFLSGIEYRWEVQLFPGSLIIFMTAMVVVFTTSTITGVYRGIRRLSLVTAGGLMILLCFTFIIGPTGYVLKLGTNAVGQYVTEFVSMSTLVSGDWARSWTLYYWSWWYSWAPFVGLFIARISKGRTIREVIISCVLLPSIATIGWFTVMGGTAIELQQNSTDILGVVSERGASASGFPFFSTLPLGDLLLFLFLGLIIVFLVTSADSATLVISYLTTEADYSPRNYEKIIWGIILAVLSSTVVLLRSSELLRSAAVLTGAPIMILAIIAIFTMIGSVLTDISESGKDVFQVTHSDRADNS